MRRRSLGLALILAAALPSPARADLPPEARRLEATLRGLRGLHAEFVQIRDVLLSGEQIEATGFLAFRPPGDFRLVFETPEAQELVVAQDSLWIVMPAEKQAQRFPYRADDPGNEIFFLFGGGEGRSLDSVYDIVQEPWGSHAEALRLTPRSREPGYPIEEIRLVLREDGYPGTLFFREVTGDTVVMRFTRIVRDPGNISDLLRLRLPPDTEVISVPSMDAALGAPDHERP